MKIWVTRQSAFSIQCGGLERLLVWFRQPTWVEEWRTELQDDTPFEDLSDMNGRKTANWEVRQSGVTWIDRPVSFGKLFGYSDRKEETENEIANYVWHQLEKHFGNTPFEQWHEYEKENTSCCRKNFILEIDIKVSFS